MRGRAGEERRIKGGRGRKVGNATGRRSRRGKTGGRKTVDRERGRAADGGRGTGNNKKGEKLGYSIGEN